MTKHDRIQLDESICHGRPIIRGTRITAASIIGSLASGMTIDEIEAEYDISGEDVRAALAYAADLMGHERHFPLAG